MTVASSVINVIDKNTGKGFNPCEVAGVLRTTAADLAAEVRKRNPNKDNISLGNFPDATWPEDKKLEDYLLNMENVLTYYSINSGKIAKNAKANSYLIYNDSYYESIIRMIKDRIDKYLGHSLAIRCFDGKVGRGIYFKVDLTRVESNEALHLYSITQIVIGKTASTKTGKKDNHFRFLFSEDGICTSQDIVAETMAGQFNSNRAKEILSDIEFLLERFNKAISSAIERIRKQSLEYKRKNYKLLQADHGDRILNRLQSMQTCKNQKEEVTI